MNSHQSREIMKHFSLSILTCITALILGSCGEQRPETNDDKSSKESTQSEGGRAIGLGKSSELVLTRQQVRAAGIATQKAEVKPVSSILTLSGKVALNERLAAHITARVRGRVEQVHRVAGDHAMKGEAVVELYSQEFLTMQAEFIQAEERLKRMSSDQSDYGTAQAIYQSAKKKLQLVGMTDSELEALADNHNPLALLPVRAPFNGALLTGEAHLGSFVEVGSEFFTIANLQTPWVIADVLEHDLPLVSEGLRGDVTVAPYPNEKFKGQLTSIIDQVDEKSRTVKVRFEVQNRQEELKPGMFATVNLDIRVGGKNVIVPSSAVMENKDAQYLFVALDDTTFEQRPVKIGTETKAYTEILEGLKTGEAVVFKGTFFLKSEMGKASFMEEE